MRKILLTGFEPFLAYSENPTGPIVTNLHDEIINDYRVIGKVLPVEFVKAGEKITALIKEHEPDIVVSLGIAGSRSKISPERIAINCMSGAKDNEGYKPENEKIVEAGSDGLFTSLPIVEMVEHLKENQLPAEISNTAGTYVCNNVMYHSLHYIQEHNLQVKSGFIHLPISHNLAVEGAAGPSWSLSDLQKAVELCLKCL